MVEHTEDGALGVVLNRLANRSVAELWHEVSDEACDDPRPVNLGGPVSGPLIAIHTDENLAEMEILPGVYLAAQKSNLDRLVAQTEHHYRVYLGHSGWGRGQLEGELEARRLAHHARHARVCLPRRRRPLGNRRQAHRRRGAARVAEDQARSAGPVDELIVHGCRP